MGHDLGSAPCKFVAERSETPFFSYSGEACSLTGSETWAPPPLISSARGPVAKPVSSSEERRNGTRLGLRPLLFHPLAVQWRSL